MWMHRKAEEESHSGVLWATTRTQRGAAWTAHTSSDFGCSALGAFLVFARRHARPSHTRPVKHVLRFRHGSARTTLRCDASNAGRSISSFKQALHRGSGCARELNPAAGLERWS